MRTGYEQLATLCLFLVITSIVFCLQVYSVYSRVSPAVTVVLTLRAGLFAWRANRTLLRFGRI